ncbi:Lipase_GDSL domain-containing protein [Cephalotus follicularis]|uniref:Lipase_GDSL domain-containing protein n=1 Tax=Cephalotus follicularis TaxID=3775 RepID=A0A1Q3B095_CEPFO|nr:Lipase_GDSL domain-containing protein [Cephalotus follicularis]
MASLSHYFLCVTILCVMVLHPMSCYGECHDSDHIYKQLFVFGDSLFDPGNNQYLETGITSTYNYYPYGITYFNHPTGRATDGRVVPDFIAKFAKLNYPLPFLKPGAVFTHGAGFASAGASALGLNANVMNLAEQISNFKKLAATMQQILGPDVARKILMKSVYLISIGGNDYFIFNTRNKNSSLSNKVEYTGSVMGNIVLALEELYAIGARRFAFQDVGPLGCQPMSTQINPETEGECEEKYLTHARLHNKFLRIALEELKNDLPRFKYAVFDYYKALGDRIENPTKYGFKYGDVGCCGTGEYNGRNCGGGGPGGVEFNLCSDPNEYLFFDGGHTTERANEQLAQLLWDGPPHVTGPYNVKKLFEP